MFVELRDCDESSKDECSESDWELVFIEKPKKNGSDKKGDEEKKWKEGVIFPRGYVDCLEKKEKEKEEAKKKKEEAKKKKEKEEAKEEAKKEEKEEAKIEELEKEIKELEKKIKELGEKIEALSGDKKKILCTDNSLQAIACAYQSTNYDGFFFSDLDKVKDLAQIFRTYSLPYLLIVEVKESKLDEGTETKIINALKAGVDYIAVDKDLMAELENKMKGDESEEDNTSDNGDDSAS
jgi:ATP-dependent 26S proteasome regulatory subunit